MPFDRFSKTKLVFFNKKQKKFYCDSAELYRPTGLLFFKVYLLLQFEWDLLETWYTCSLDEGARCAFGGFFNFWLECHQVAFLSKIRFES